MAMINVVQNETGQTSSIGAVWPPAAGTGERFRGFYTEGIIQTANDCQMIGELFQHHRAELARDPELSRLSIRFVAQAAQLRLFESMGIAVEAAIPLSGTNNNLALTYIGHNEPQRSIDSGQLQGHDRTLNSILQNRQRDLRDRSAMLQEAGFTPNIITRETSDGERRLHEQQFLNMYRIFGYDLSDVRDILSNESNTIVFIEREGAIASTAMAERASIPVAGFGNLELYEITEASTHPNYRQRGLYKAVSGLLLEHLLAAQADDPVHAIYGESNLAMPGVLIAGYENGRNFNYFDRERFGLHSPGFGILPQNFHIDDGKEQRQYNDFAVSYVPINLNGDQS